MGLASKAANYLLVSVPLPGFSGLRLVSPPGRSPLSINVSVPLPGFSGLRPRSQCSPLHHWARRFSPVAGIQWVETLACFSFSEKDNGSFSPVAGIQWVETLCYLIGRRCAGRVSVPLPGFSGLRLPFAICLSWHNMPFQSRCRDSVG